MKEEIRKLFPLEFYINKDEKMCGEISLENLNKIIDEIERLNNILDELEKYIASEYYCFDNESVEFEVSKNILNYLKELKEGK